MTSCPDARSEQAGALPKRISVAVTGNPNAGKTTVFNALTGSNAKIGNYPGITVDRRTGVLKLPRSGRVELVDVPGTYSLTTRSKDEEVAINELLGRKGITPPAAAIVVLDATALERSLYFLMQVLEFDIPVVAVVNMMDVASKEGIQVRLDELERLFGIRFIGLVGRSRKGIPELKIALDELLASRDGYRPPDWFWKPNAALEHDLAEFDEAIEQQVRFPLSKNGRRAFALWMLMSLGEHSKLVVRPQLKKMTLESQERIKQANRDLDAESTLERYAFIDAQAHRFIVRPDQERINMTDRIDTVLTHPVWGLMVFLAIMGTIFQALFSWSDPFIGWIEELFGMLSVGVQAVMAPGILRDLITDGIIAGVGGVLVFLPQILFLFLFIGLLEGSGYLARAAFLIDRLMRKIGLHGQAFVPMLSGFACAVPAIMAARTIQNRRDRMLTMMVIPLMSCSARLPVYTLVIAMLFPADQKVGPLSVGTLMLLGIYVLSTLFAFLAAAVMGRTLFRGQAQNLLLELPPYRLPDIKSVAMVLWERTKVFMSTAGTIILVMTVILWVLLSFPRLDDESAGASTIRDESAVVVEPVSEMAQSEQLKHSYAGRLGALIEPLIAPLGFDWKIGIGLIGAFAAREVFVGTMGVVYGLGEAQSEESHSLRRAMLKDRRPDGTPLWTPLVGMSLLIFFMIAMQCMSTLAVVLRETKSWAWTFFMLAYMTGAAYLVSLLVYQGGRWLGFS